MIALLLAALAVSSSDSLKAEFGTVAKRWVENARDQGQVIDSVDALVFERTVEELGFYLDDKYGERKRRKVFSRVRTPDELTEKLDDVIDRRFASLYPDFYSWSEERYFPGQGWSKAESGHFIYLYRSGSAASVDLELIEVSAEGCFSDVVRVLGIDSLTLTRLSRVVQGSGSTNQLTAGKIPIRIYSSRAELRGHELALGGETLFRPTWFGDTVCYFLEIRLAYPGPAGLFGLPHEMAHALAGLFLADETKLTDILKRKTNVSVNSMRDAVPADDFLRSEGWAYMVQYNYFSYTRLGLMRTTLQMAQKMAEEGNLPEVEDLIKEDVPATFTERVFSWIGLDGIADSRRAGRLNATSADLIRFLYTRYGSEKLCTFLTEDRPAQNALLSVYKITHSRLTNMWKDDIMDGK
ncbi:hypothetical protein JXM67_02325 [candidate division WOR-3 bacterium]|nr:hypothetical protein [candidate division WOR-3 bacterium]